jgi:hypothetical protein
MPVGSPVVVVDVDDLVGPASDDESRDHVEVAVHSADRTAIR